MSEQELHCAPFFMCMILEEEEESGPPEPEATFEQKPNVQGRSGTFRDVQGHTLVKFTATVS